MYRKNIAVGFALRSVFSAFILLAGFWLAMLGTAGLAAGSDIRPPQQQDADSEQDAAEQFVIVAPVTWTQRIEAGFGLPAGEIEQSGVHGVMALASFDDQLYAGGSAWFNYGERRLSRTEDGQTWEEIIGTDFERWNNYEISSLAVYNNFLYAGTRNYTMEGDSEGAEIWRSPDGVTWSAVVTGGLGDVQQTTVASLVEFDGHLYAGTHSITDTHGAEIWGSVDGVEWEKVVTGGLDDDNASEIRALHLYDGALYAAVANYTDGAEVWRSIDGLAWTRVLTGGSDIVRGSNPPSANALAGFGSYLYAYLSGRNGVILLRCEVCDGEDWAQATEPGFGNPSNLYRGALLATQDTFYAAVGNGKSGLEVWRTRDGKEWEQIATGGFGDAGNVYTVGQGAVTVFADRLYVGTWNETEGGQVWSLYLGPTFLVEVQRNANLRGGPGTNYAVNGGVKRGDFLEVVGQNKDETLYQLGNVAWISSSLVARVAPEPETEADSAAPVTVTVQLTATPQTTASISAPSAAELHSLLQTTARTLEDEAWRLRSETVLSTGVTHTIVTAYAPPDRYGLIADEETHFIFIGDDAYTQEDGEWTSSDLSADRIIFDIKWLAAAENELKFIGADELNGQAMLVYRYPPPATNALSAQDVTLWFGEDDKRLYKIVIIGKVASTHMSDGEASSEVEYKDATTTLMYEYDQEITIERPIE